MNRKNVEDLYTLTPLQQGILFHALHSPQADAYAEQIVLSLEGDVRPDAFARAWQTVVDLHPALRTGFVWEGVPQPLQVVFRQAQVPVRVEDWSALADDDREARWDALLREDRAAGWELRRAPLLRLALARVGEREWRFLFSGHHLLVDGWSMALVMADFTEAYRAERDGGAAELERRPAFRDYVIWLGKRDERVAEAFWRARLAGVDEPTPLPLDLAPARAGLPAEEHGQETLPIPIDTVRMLAEAGRRLRVTPSTLAQAAWAAVLARYTGRRDVVFGATVSGRTPGVPGVEEMVGLFINTVPVRVGVPGAGSAVEWLRALQAEQAEARDHELSPLAQVRGWSGVPGDAPLFETLFVFENYPLTPAGQDGEAAFAIMGSHSAERTNYALSLVVAPTIAGMRATATYDARRLDAKRARTLLTAFETVLRRLAAGEDDLSAALDPMPADERERVVVEWNRTSSPYPREPVHRVFEALAAENPDAIALRWDGGTLDYGTLNANANLLARRLRALGVGPEDRVGVSLERSPEVIVALLAILKAGGAYVPLDPAYPPARLEHMRRDADVRVVIVASTREAAEATPWAGEARVVALEEEREAMESQSSADLAEVDVDAEGLAYVLYTSGSTGLPKGVGVPHRAVVRLARGQDFARFGADEVVLQMAPVAFDASTFEIWGPLLNGGCAAVHPPEAPEPRALGDFVSRHGVTTAWLTAGLFHRAVDEGLPGFQGLRQLLAGGDVLSPPHVARALELLPRTRLINGYGPTEATTFTACHTVAPGDLDGGPIPVGRPLANARCYVVDSALSPVPAGAPGELLVGGDGLARGYLGRPALTAEAFVPDPFAEAGARLYRTGDHVRWRESAEAEGGSAPEMAEAERTHAPAHPRTAVLEFLGRIDQQVKVRGFRIEPGEIEAALRAHPAVLDAVVVTRGEGELRRLVAYVTPGEVDAAALRAHAAERLPEHMVPSAIVALDALPLTPNGKVDRRALPEPDFAASEEVKAGLATPTEELLAEVWREVLGVESLGAGDDFFLLGGHSLLAMKVVSRVRTVFAAELPVRDVFEASTLRAMAARIDALRTGEAAVPPPPIEPAPRDAPLPLSYGQERLWLMERLSTGALAYGVTVSLLFAADADEGVLAGALGEVIRRHEALRTVFQAGEGGGEQVVEPPHAVEVPVDELRGHADPAQAVREAASATAATPFDLERGPLVRARLLRFGQASVLLVTLHHIAFDGWSIRVLERELRVLHDAFARGEPSPLPPLAVQYADYAVWQRRWLESGVLDAQVEFWRRALEGAPAALDLPADRPRPAARTHAGARRFFQLPAGVIQAARELARREGATLYMVLLAAFDVLLARLSGSDDVVVGAQVAGRTREETEGLIGIFVNGIALRTDLSGNPSFREAVARVRRTTLDAYAHSDVPFQRLVDALGVERTLSHPPLFNVSFLLQTDGSVPVASAPAPGDGGAALPEEPVPFAAENELGMELHEVAGGVVGSASYSTELFDHDTAARIISGYRRLLEALVAAPDAPISAPPAMDEAERRRVVETWNATAAPAPRAPLHRLFEARAAAAPHALALVAGDERLAFGELNARANRLARRLRALGVGAETLVALSLPRSAEMVVALLAVGKAGGAFLPVDPAYPAERRRWMLEDAGARLVLTTSALAAGLPETGAAVVALDRIAGEIEGGDDADLSVEVDPENAAYVIFTSGSTGRPKGVVVPHRGIGNLAAAQAEAFGVEPGGRVLQLASFSFDAAVAEVAHALLSGAALVMAFPRHAGPALLGLLRDEAVTVATLTPALLAALPEAGLPALRTIVSAGEAVSSDVVARWGAGRRFVNAYGPTEATVCATVSISPDKEGRPPIGKPLANVRTYVLDARMSPVPVGVPGELYVGGIGVARGYLGRPALTAERFVPDALSGEAGARLYRTGDRARWRRDGQLDFAGRLDQQVKVRGFRIEPGEVEAALLEHEGVREAVVLARGDGDSARLVAYVAPAEVDVVELRAHLAARLPAHLVPSAMVALEEMPLTPTGKVDRRALPDPEVEAGVFVAPRTPLEAAIAEMVGEVLQVSPVGAHDNFFALGGHSLRGMQVLSRIEARLGVLLPMTTLFATPTVAGLAAAVEALRPAGAEAAGEEAKAGEMEEGPRVVPLSPAQARLWVLSVLAGEALPNAVAALRLASSIDADTLTRAVDSVVRRREVLRSYAELREGEPVMVVLPAGWVGKVDEAGEAGESAVERMAEAEATRPFEEDEPFFRIHHLRSGDGDALVCALHPLAAEEVSAAEVAAEVVAALGAIARGGAPHLPSPVDTVDGAEAYWRARLADAPRLLELPTDRPRPAVQGLRGAVETALLPSPVLEGARALAAAEGTAPSLVLLAALDVVLARLSGQDDVVVGARPPGAAHLAALRVDLSGAPSFRELLARVYAAADGARKADLPHGRVLELLDPPPAPGHAPLFQARLGYAEAVDGIAAAPLAAPAPPAVLDLALDATETADGLALSLAYDAALFDAARMRELLAQVGAVLAQAAGDPYRSIGALSLVTEAARAVLPDPRAPLAAEPWRRAVHEAFAAVASSSPGSPAVVDGSKTWTYAALDEAANRTAHALTGAGVSPGEVVAVWAHRSAALVRALLGAWKAGAAFAVLDPAYPPARLAAQVRAARPAALLRIAAAGQVPAEVAAALGESVRATIDLEMDEKDGGDALPSTAPPVSVGPDDLAYVAFTSGTTGAPKAIAGTHRPLAHFFGWYAEELGLRATDRVSLLAGLAHDPLLRDVFAPLVAGGAVVVPDPAQLSTPGWLAEWLREAGVTVAHLTPALARVVTADDEAASLPALRLACFGGDVLRAADVEALRALAPGVEAVNLYGATETPQAMAAWRVPRAASGASALPLGRGIDGVDLLVVAPSGVPAGVGELGEVVVRTPYLARGYLNDAELTAARFVANPATGDAADRVYRTGDLGRYRADGAVEPAGRADRQVKVRGFRVEPGEVEAALAKHASVREAVADTRGEGDGKRLVAWLTGAGERPKPSALREHLRALVPEFMVPSAFVWLDALPLTPNGKVDRRALPDPHAPPPAAPVAPRTPAEEVVAEVWREVLGVEELGVEDDFFARGGRWSTAVRAVAGVSRALEVELPLRALFDAPTVAGLAAAVEAAGGGAMAHALAGLDDMSEDELAALLAEIGDGE